MGSKSIDDMLQPTNLQEALNIIKFMKTTHKHEVTKLKEMVHKQSDKIKKLEMSRKTELEYLSSELQKYELNLALRTESVRKQLIEKDEIITKQLNTIEELDKKLKIRESTSIPQVNIQVESNSDSGVVLDNDDSLSKNTQKTEAKAARKCNRRFADPIGFLRRVDFSPMKYKPSKRDATKKKEDKKTRNLEVPNDAKVLNYHSNTEKATSDEDRPSEEASYSDGVFEPVILKPKIMNDSMNNHFSDDGSEDTSEETFDRVMTRSSIRRSVKANPKYKKINRTKAKLLSQVTVNIVD